MESKDKNQQHNNQLNDDAHFENPDVDPGFLGHQDDAQPLKGREDKRAHNIDANLSIKEMREAKESEAGGNEDEDAQQDDAMNYKNDREKGSYNPKNI